jgi:calcineurin-like phosphoesterase family protein
MTIHFTGDLHIGHKGILRLTNRGYTTMVDMVEAINAAWRQTVAPNDDVYVLGDFGFGPSSYLAPIFDALPGRKHLIIGNHDEQNPAVLKLPWASMAHYRKVRLDGRRIILSHYPFTTWDGAHRGYLHLHGHSHGTLLDKRPGRMDVGVDALGRFAPITFDDVVTVLDAEAYVPIDHHRQEGAA